MRLKLFQIRVLSAALFLVLLIPGPAAGFDPQLQIQAQTQAPERISRFGEYKGYSPEIYDSWARTSRYLTMRDGVRLAADIIRPALGGKVEEKPLPAIFIHTRYRRSSIQNGKIVSEADSPLSQVLLKHGYSLLVVDVRGSGASFGAWRGMFDQDETRDAYEIIEWLAGRSWCDGKIGMYGLSYLGTTQLMAASTKPPHLKALFPIVPIFDIYDVFYHGGVFYEDLLKTWSALTGMFDTRVTAAPVDDDPDGALLKQAIQGHAANRPAISIFSVLRFRDDRDQVTGSSAYQDWGAAGKVKPITDSKIPMYIWGGWFDSFTRDVFLMHKNFLVPKKLVVGAWSHSPKDPAVQKEEYALAAVEGLRWFDYWLKGIDNGIMGEPEICYQVMKAPHVNEWRTASTWPLPDTKSRNFYFLAGSSGSVASINDGLLSMAKPSDKDGRDVYAVDFTATTGTATRWDNAVGGGFGYPDMTANDSKGLTYTTPPLDRDVEVTGHPVVHLWVSSSASDGDFFAFLEEVDASGASRYVTEGALKASHRAPGKPAYDDLGLPYHRDYARDAKPLKPGEAVELVFDLEPTSNIFEAGNRIRVTIVCADKDNAETRPVTPPPTITIFRSAGRDSRIVLPVVPARTDKKPG